MPNEGLRSPDVASPASTSSHEGVSFGTPPPEGGRVVGSPSTNEERQPFFTPGRLVVIGGIILLVAGVVYWRVATAERREEYTVAAAREQQSRTQAEQLAQQMQQLDEAQQKSLTPPVPPDQVEPPSGGGVALPSQRPATTSVPDITDTIGAPRVSRGADIPSSTPVETSGGTSPAGTPPPDASPLDAPGFATGGIPNGDPALLASGAVPSGNPSSARSGSSGGQRAGSEAAAREGGSVAVNYRGRSISMSSALADSSRRPAAPPPPPPPVTLSPPGGGSETSLPAAAETSARQVSRKPPFGAYIPVRLLGAFSTHADQPSQSYLRFETIRDAVGPNWRVPRGAQWIGQVDPRMFDGMRMGNNLKPPERLSVRFIGYIDPLEQKLVPVGGEAHGEDGNPGLKAERKRVDARWTYALARTLGIGLDILYQRLAYPAWVLPNIGDLNVVLPVPIGGRGGFGGGFGGPGINTANAMPPPQPQYLLRVASNQMAYILVNELPPTMDGRQIQMVETVLQPTFGGMGGMGTPGMGGMGGLGTPGMGGMGGMGTPGMGGMGGLGTPGMGGMGGMGTPGMGGMGGLGTPGMGGMGGMGTPGMGGMGGMGTPGNNAGRGMSPGNNTPGAWTPGMPTDPASQREYLELLQMLQSIP